MIILFPSNPLNPKSVDQSFGHEAHMAKEAGFKIGRVDLEILLGGDVKLSGVERERGNKVLYRGWLMAPQYYQRLDQALDGRLITGYYNYLDAYELPRWYNHLKDKTTTPETLMLPQKQWDNFSDLDAVAEEIHKAFGNGPCLVKDYVKSAKHRWHDACYIQSASDLTEVKRVIKNFLEIASTNLMGGLCIRKFEKFKQIGIHSKIQMPLINEWRAFLVFGKLLYLCPYWAEADYAGACARPDTKTIEKLAEGLEHLPFIALDLAEAEDGKWWNVEVNDGGAAGVPEPGNTSDFFKALFKPFGKDFYLIPDWVNQ